MADNAENDLRELEVKIWKQQGDWAGMYRKGDQGS
jgi:hypothetical protein